MNCPYLQMNTNVYIFSKYITIYKSNSELQTFYFHSKNEQGVLRSKNMGHKINGPKATQLSDHSHFQSA